ncbi:MAG TPA: MFS transporter [Micromonosporaceae bacterium]|jgi:DHA2 family multidrug resistance protein-like MFS transporter
MNNIEVTLASRRAWLGLAVLVLPTFLVALDMTALFLTLPRLSADLGASSIEQLWITDSYGFMVAGFVIAMGTLGDRIGRRRLLLIGAAGFALASITAAYAVDPPMLIAARALMGIAGATLAPSTLALITSMFRSDRQRGKAISIWATCQFAGGALGPVIGGLLLQRFWWGSVFLVSVPVMALLVMVGPAVLPEFRNPTAARVDLISVALSLAAVLPVVYGLKQLTVDGTHSPMLPACSILLGAVVGVVFVRRQLTLTDPLLNLRLFANRPFTGIVVALILAGISMAGTGLMVTQYLQSVLGYSPLATAILFTPMGLGIAVGTITAPALARRVPPPVAIGAGLALSAIGSALLIRADGLAGVIIGIAVQSLGAGPLFALGIGLVLGSVPPERAGSAASISETANYFGGSLGLAVLGAIGASVYRGGMAGVGVPTTAGATIAGAEAFGRHLPPGPAAELLRAARDAFTSGLHATSAIAAVAFIGAAILVALTSRTGTPQSVPEPTPTLVSEPTPALVSAERLPV